MQVFFSYSHAKFGTEWYAPLKHAAQAHAPDKTYNDIPLANEALKGTFYQLRNYKKTSENVSNIKKFDVETDQRWSTIEGAANTYNSSPLLQNMISAGNKVLDIYNTISGNNKK